MLWLPKSHRKKKKKGASYAIIEEEQFAVNNQCKLNQDVLKTFQQLAHYHLKSTAKKLLPLPALTVKLPLKSW